MNIGDKLRFGSGFFYNNSLILSAKASLYQMEDRRKSLVNFTANVSKGQDYTQASVSSNVTSYQS